MTYELHPLQSFHDDLVAVLAEKRSADTNHAAYLSHRTFLDHIKDLFRASPTRAALDQATATLRHREESMVRARNDWLAMDADRALQKNEAAGQTLMRLQSELALSQENLATVRSYADDLRHVVHKLARAIDAAANASSLEFVDMFTKNKGIALVSYAQTDSAKDALEAARTALEEFVAKWNTEDARLELGSIHNGTDLLLDMSGFGFDFMSYFNMSALDDAKEKASRIKKRLEGLSGTANAKQFVAQAEVDQLQRQIDAVKDPFIRQSRASLPAHLFLAA